jgi:hypothetical protein
MYKTKLISSTFEDTLESFEHKDDKLKQER